MEEHEKLFEKLKKKGYLEKIRDDLKKLKEKYERNKEKVIEFLRKVLSKDHVESVEQPEDLYILLLAKLSLSEKAGDLNLLEYQLKIIYPMKRYLKPWRIKIQDLLVKGDEVLKLVLGHSKFQYERIAPEIEAYMKLEEISKRDEKLEPVISRKIREILPRMKTFDKIREFDLESYLSKF